MGGEVKGEEREGRKKENIVTSIEADGDSTDTPDTPTDSR